MAICVSSAPRKCICTPGASSSITGTAVLTLMAVVSIAVEVVATVSLTMSVVMGTLLDARMGGLMHMVEIILVSDGSTL